MRNEYEIALDVLNQLRNSTLNPDQKGGLEAQLEQLYGCANGVFAALAANSEDSTFYVFNKILREVRKDE